MFDKKVDIDLVLYLLKFPLPPNVSAGPSYSLPLVTSE